MPVFFGAVLFCLAPSLAGASTWTLTPVDNIATDTGKYSSLAMDTNNFLHVSYFDVAGSVKYATNKSGSWALPTVVSSGMAAGTAIAVDAATNYPNIVYYSGSNPKGSKFQAYNGTAWATAVNISGGNVAPAADTVTAMQNKSGIAHAVFSKSGTLYYNRNTTASNYATWNTATQLDTTAGSGFNSALAVDAAGFVHVVGYNSASTDLFYYTNASGSWVKTTLQSSTNDVGKYCSIAVGMVGATETLLVAYHDTTGNNVMFTSKPVSGGSWLAPFAVTAAGDITTNKGGFVSLAADAVGAAHISFYYNNAGTANLKYATNLGGSWHVESVETANVGQYSSIAVGTDQSVAIAYYDVTNTALKVATRGALLATTANFGTVDRGFQSTPNSTVTLTNNLPVNQTIGTIGKGGTNPGEFIITSDSCTNIQLLPQGQCTLQLYFAPPASDPRSSTRTATLSIPATVPYVLAYSTALSGITSANYLLSAGAGNGGSISPPLVAVAAGGSQTFTVTPNSGFSVGSVTDSVSGAMGSPYALSSIAADHTVTAAFVSPIRIFDTAIFYGSLQSAFDATADNWTIQSQVTIPAGDLLVDRNITTILSGGYDSSFTSQSGNTVMFGNVIISDGTLEVKNLEFR
jgi:hypothetical protein